MQEWPKQASELEQLLRLRTFPLAFRRCEKAEEIETIPQVRRLKHHPTFCQILTLARTAGWTIGATGDDVASCPFPQRAGLVPTPDDAWSKRVGTWLGSTEDGEKCRDALDAFYTIPGPCQALVLVST